MAKEMTQEDHRALPKFTESELKARHCGKMVDTRGDSRWKQKKETYGHEGVWIDFTALRDSFRALATDYDGHVYNDYANHFAQLLMDSYLIRRSRGEVVSIPKKVVPINAAPGEKTVGIELLDADQFTKKKNVSENEKLRWVLENMQIDGLIPADAPTPGAWFMLQAYRSSPLQQKEFYRTMFPKLMSKEDAEKSGKLQDTGKDTRDLIDKLLAALPPEGSE